MTTPKPPPQSPRVEWIDRLAKLVTFVLCVTALVQLPMWLLEVPWRQALGWTLVAEFTVMFIAIGFIYQWVKEGKFDA